MPNLLDATGLTIATQSELLTGQISAFQKIYGPDINLDPDSPDGQIINIWIQVVIDMLNLLLQIYNMFDPDNAIGNVLDQRVSTNGIQRQAGTFTVTNITLVVSQALNLAGLDQSANPVYTVADNAGNQWQLIDSVSIATSGTYVYAFQAANPGAVQTVPNTITQAVTVVLGVTSINNPTTYSTLGVNEESDAALKIRRQQSVSLSSQGYYNGLKAALLNIIGVTSATIVENDTGSTVNSVPEHSIWVIVAGTGAAADIAQAIYTKRNAACGMYNSGGAGAQSFSVQQADGSFFTVFWDDVVAEDLFIKFTATSINGVNPPNIAAIRLGLITKFIPGVDEEVNINQLATYVQQIDPNTLVTNAGFSLSSGGSYTNTLSPSAANKQFALTEEDIIIIPIILNPVTVSVAHGGVTQQFTQLGGFGTMTYSVLSSTGGGSSINSSSGLYTSGNIGTDVVQVTDSLSNTATATVTVT